MKQDSQARIVLCTCPDEKTAQDIAGRLVKGRLAACANIIPGLRSVFEWQGKVEIETECQLIIKTTVNCLEELEKLVNEHHPYELPELIAVPVSDGSVGYLDWIVENTQ